MGSGLDCLLSGSGRVRRRIPKEDDREEVAETSRWSDGDDKDIDKLDVVEETNEPDNEEPYPDDEEDDNSEDCLPVRGIWTIILFAEGVEPDVEEEEEDEEEDGEEEEEEGLEVEEKDCLVVEEADAEGLVVEEDDDDDDDLLADEDDEEDDEGLGREVIKPQRRKIIQTNRR